MALSDFAGSLMVIINTLPRGSWKIIKPESWSVSPWIGNEV